MRIHQLIKESFEDWDTGKWVHYSDFNMLKINPSPFHQDPIAIYFFPEKFKPKASMWKNKKYKFVITLKPTARVLDFSNITDEQLNSMLTATNATEMYQNYIQQYPPKDKNKKLHMAWEMMRSSMVLGSGGGRAKWNTILRDLGWDAIFDDTGSIHSSEVQLMIINPTIVASIEKTRSKIDGFSAMKKVIDDFVNLLEQYGEVTVEEPKKEKNNRYSSSQGSHLRAKISVKKSDDNYADFSLVWDPNDNTFKDKISISLRWSRPSLNYGSGAVYDIHSGEYESFSNLDNIKKDMDKVFSKKDQE